MSTENTTIFLMEGKRTAKNMQATINMSEYSQKSLKVVII